MEDWINELEKLQDQYNKYVELDLLVSNAELDMWLHREEVQLSQYAKVHWWKFGDNNSCYFCSLLNKRKQAKVVEMKLFDGSILKSP